MRGEGLREKPMGSRVDFGPFKDIDMNQAGIAAVLSFLLPGLGQIYNGDFLRAIFWLIVTAALWFFLMGWICHLVASFTAYRRGRMYMSQQRPS